MEADLQLLLDWMKQRGISPAIIDRVKRLNPNYQRCEFPRGMRPRLPQLLPTVGRGEFLRTHGREAYDSIPRMYIIKDGRRRRITAQAVRMRVWEAPPACCSAVAVQLDRRFYNQNPSMKYVQI
jgi:hypothetical protein